VVCGELLEKMEHGSHSDNSSSTFSLVDEDHTLANALRFTLNQESVLSLYDSSLQKKNLFCIIMF
jgi:DNA-directed RNA polymerase subunit L